MRRQSHNAQLTWPAGGIVFDDLYLHVVTSIMSFTNTLRLVKIESNFLQKKEEKKKNLLESLLNLNLTLLCLITLSELDVGFLQNLLNKK